MDGLIVKAISGFYYVASGGRVYECKARGSFRNSGVSPLAGDRAEFEISGDSGVVIGILPRRNSLGRPPVANIDKLFIVSAYEKPAPNAYLIDKITAVAEYNGIEPIIVFNKCDLGGFEEWCGIYSRAGFKTFAVSAESGEGVGELKNELKNCVSAFTGNSGVGKSSILNSLGIGLELTTGDISDKLGRGRHTTRHTELFPLPFGGFVADTPGFSSIAYDGADYAFKEKLVYCFPEFVSFLGGCRFASCTHTGEAGCAVKEAVCRGEIEESRYNSYIQLFAELKDLRPWTANKNKKQ